MNYIFTNKLSIGGWIWRCALILFVVGLIGLIGGWIFVRQGLTTDRVTAVLARPEIVQQINKIGTLLSGDQYIHISQSSGFITNKTGIRYESSDAIVAVDLETNCEDRFTHNTKKGVLITNKSLCVVDTSKQQVITRSQIMSGVVAGHSGSDLDSSTGIFAQYSGLSHLISGDAVVITADILQSIQSDLATMTQDPQIIASTTDIIKNIASIMIIPLCFILVMIVGLATVILLSLVLLYSLITWAIAGIMKYDISFEQAFAISWLPWIIINILATIGGIARPLQLLIWVIVIAALIYSQKSKETNITGQ